MPFCKSQVYSSSPCEAWKNIMSLTSGIYQVKREKKCGFEKKYLISCKTSSVSSTPARHDQIVMGFASRDNQSPNRARAVWQLGEITSRRPGWGGPPRGGVDVPSAHPIDERLKQSYNQATEKTRLNCLVQLLEIKSAAQILIYPTPAPSQGKPKLTCAHIKKL